MAKEERKDHKGIRKERKDPLLEIKVMLFEDEVNVLKLQVGDFNFEIINF